MWKRNSGDIMNKVYCVHTMGRVGSRSVSHSLFGQGYAAVHTHNFNPVANPYEMSAKYILDCYQHFDTEVWVISNVRDIVARNLSVYAHTHAEPNATEFLTKYPKNAAQMWLSKEIVNYWGAPIFEMPFNKDRGWTIYPSRQPNAHVVMVQLEKLESEWSAIWTAMGNPSGAVPTLARIGESHKSVYEKFEITGKYLDEVYGSLVSQTFYNAQDIEIMRSKHES